MKLRPNGLQSADVVGCEWGGLRLPQNRCEVRGSENGKAATRLSGLTCRVYYRTNRIGGVSLQFGGGSMAPLKVGEIAPDFEVPAVIGTEKVTVKLSDYRGKKNVLLAFYPLDWTPV